MSIEKEYGKYYLVCDQCLERLEGGEKYLDAVNIGRIEGWRSYKIKNGSWENICPYCE